MNNQQAAKYLRDVEGFHVSKVLSVEEVEVEKGCGEPICNCTWPVDGTKITWVNSQGLTDWEEWDVPPSKLLEELNF